MRKIPSCRAIVFLQDGIFFIESHCGDRKTGNMDYRSSVSAAICAWISSGMLFRSRCRACLLYTSYLLMCCGFGLIPLVLLVCGALKVQWPSIVSSACCVIVLAAFGIFQGGSVWSELKKSLHL